MTRALRTPPRARRRDLILTRSPLRISLGGGGTDLPSYYRRHGGFVLATAIDRYVQVCVARLALEDGVRAKQSRTEEVGSAAELSDDLLRHALAEAGLDEGVEVATVADVPLGTGLGSSGSYVTALLAALLAAVGRDLDPERLAELAFEVEAMRAGRPVGKQDHYTAALGGVVALEIDQDGSVRRLPLRLSPETVEELERRLLLFYTGIRRDAGPLLRAQQDAVVQGESGAVASLHLSKEVGREIMKALAEGRVDAIGPLFHEHWASKRRRAPGMTDPAIDRWYDLACRSGARGGKLIGAGGGGFLVLDCPQEAAVRVCEVLAEAGLRELPWRVDPDGSTLLHRS